MATYYVRTDGSNSNTGTTNSAGGAWLTIGKAETTMIAGDTARVQAGLYDERVAVTGTTGTIGSPITYIADGAAICRGFDLTSVDYIRIIGFEITHDSTTYVRGIALLQTCSHIDILGNYIHDTNGPAIQGRIGSTTSYVTIRGNTFYFIGNVPGVSTTAVTVISTEPINTDRWLVEYNTCQRCGDFVNIYGTNSIIRNNYFHEFSNALLNVTDSYHQDIFQGGSGGIDTGTANQLYEANFGGDTLAANCHGAIFQDSIDAGDHDVLMRGNVYFNLGSGGAGARSFNGFRLYNETYYKTNQIAVNGDVAIWWSYGVDYSTDGLGANLLVADYGNANSTFSVPAGNTATLTNNLGYLAGADASFVSTADPLFTDATNRDFRLQSGSPAINAGSVLITVASSNGSGTSFDVNDGQLLNDGFSITRGDTITVGGTTTYITAISGNTVTVAASVTWTNGMAVYWGADATPDIGAYPYGAEQPVGTISNVGNLYTVLVSGNARFVEFFEDGIPVAIDYDAPYTYTSSGGTVTAKVYALYASATPVVDAVTSIINVTTLNVTTLTVG